MAKRGPKPRIERPKLGRRKGYTYNQTKTIVGAKDLDNAKESEIYFDTIAATEIALAYIKQYKLRPLRAARLAVCVQYSRYVYTQHAFGNVYIKDPATYKVDKKEERSQFMKDFDDSFAMSKSAEKDAIKIRKLPTHSLIQKLPAPTDVKVWIESTHPLVRRIATRISRIKQAKS